ncbi:MAG: hypothetical protein ACI9BD_000992 [Candidatus Marinamargulisbacteria bacterium]|jgi:hypothetical protein
MQGVTHIGGPLTAPSRSGPKPGAERRASQTPSQPVMWQLPENSSADTLMRYLSNVGSAPATTDPALYECLEISIYLNIRVDTIETLVRFFSNHQIKVEDPRTDPVLTRLSSAIKLKLDVEGQVATPEELDQWIETIHTLKGTFLFANTDNPLTMGIQSAMLRIERTLYPERFVTARSSLEASPPLPSEDMAYATFLSLRIQAGQSPYETVNHYATHGSSAERRQDYTNQIQAHLNAFQVTISKNEARRVFEFLEKSDTSLPMSTPKILQGSHGSRRLSAFTPAPRLSPDRFELARKPVMAAWLTFLSHLLPNNQSIGVQLSLLVCTGDEKKRRSSSPEIAASVMAKAVKTPQTQQEKYFNRLYLQKAASSQIKTDRYTLWNSQSGSERSSKLEGLIKEYSDYRRKRDHDADTEKNIRTLNRKLRKRPDTRPCRVTTQGNLSDSTLSLLNTPEQHYRTILWLADTISQTPFLDKQVKSHLVHQLENRDILNQARHLHRFQNIMDLGALGPKHFDRPDNQKMAVRAIRKFMTTYKPTTTNMGPIRDIIHQINHRASRPSPALIQLIKDITPQVAEEPERPAAPIRQAEMSFQEAAPT